jgi:signal transduction histidine kinase
VPCSARWPATTDAVHVPPQQKGNSSAHLLVNTSALILDHRRVIDRRQILRKPYASERALRLSIEASGDVGTWAIDLGQTWPTLDAGLANLWSRSIKSPIRVRKVKLLQRQNPAETARWFCRRSRTRHRDRGKRSRHHYRIVHPSAKVVWVTARNESFQIAKTGKAFAGVAVDITSRKHIEHKLHENDRRKDEFLAILAHELRNPLAPFMLPPSSLQIRKARWGQLASDQ